MKSTIGEFELIEKLGAASQKRGGVTHSIGDDAAVLGALSTPIVTCDALIENVHFRTDWTSAVDLGSKAMAVNLSDLAAMNASPVAAFVQLGLSTPFLARPDWQRWIADLYSGFESAASRFNFTIAGGDTTRTSQELLIAVTLVGEANGTPALRSGAREGDELLVTGTLGDAAAGLFLLQNPQVEARPGDAEYLLGRHLRPKPRLHEMQAAQSLNAINAALDLSDGLAGDARHIAEQSKLCLEIDETLLPISHSVKRVAAAANRSGFDVSAKNWALSGGEDYELLLCVSPEKVDAVCKAIKSATSTPITRVGRCTRIEADQEPVVCVNKNGIRRPASKAWTHF